MSQKNIPVAIAVPIDETTKYPYENDTKYDTKDSKYDTNEYKDTTIKNNKSGKNSKKSSYFNMGNITNNMSNVGNKMKMGWNNMKTNAGSMGNKMKMGWNNMKTNAGSMGNKMKTTITGVSMSKKLPILLLTLALICILVVYAVLFIQYDYLNLYSTYKGWFLFFLIMMCCIVGFYTFSVLYFLGNANSDSDFFASMSTVNSVLLKGGFLILGLVLVLWLAQFLLKMFNVQNTWISWIVNIVIVLTILGILYKFLGIEKWMTNTGILSFLMNAIFFLPCLFTGLVEIIWPVPGQRKNGKGMTLTKENDKIYVKLTVILVVCVLFLYVWKLFKNHRIVNGGKVLLEEPESLATQHSLATYQELLDFSQQKTPSPTSSTSPVTGIPYKYQYSISSWFYIDSRTPLNEWTSILNFGNKPNIVYKGGTQNSLRVLFGSSLIQNKKNKKKEEIQDKIKEKLKEKIKKERGYIEKNDQDKEDLNQQTIIYEVQNVLLQKWNHIVVNYNGGTLDIFLNGVLVQSAINLTPYMTYDALTVGTDPPRGILGRITTVVYYPVPCTLEQVVSIYESLKDKDPPVLDTFFPTLQSLISLMKRF